MFTLRFSEIVFINNGFWNVCYVRDNKQLLDEVFVISTIIKAEVGVICRILRLRLITLTETLIILDITKTESNHCFITHWTKKEKWKSCFCFFTNRKQHKARTNLTWLPLEILHRGHTWLDYPWPWVSLTWLLYDVIYMLTLANSFRAPIDSRDAL